MSTDLHGDSSLIWEAIRNLTPAPRVLRLQAAFAVRYAELGRRVYTEDTAVQARDAAILTAYQATIGEPAILRRAQILTEFARGIPISLQPDDLLVGHQTFNCPPWESLEMQEALAELGYSATTGHIIHDYASLLQRGVDGLRIAIARQRGADITGQRPMLTALCRALTAFRAYLLRNASAARELSYALDGPAQVEWHHRAHDLESIAHDPPRTFAQAVQLVWCAQIFLHVENPASAISFGRLDQYLWPFLRDDLIAERLTLPDAFSLLCAFLLKCCEGEESQNAVLGGVDPMGADAVNPLSYLLLAAMRRMATFQPSLCVRLHPATSPIFLQAAAELVVAGTGNPGFMNDEVVIAGLQALDIPLERARDWGVVGCYEATPQGDCYPNTVLGGLHLVELLVTYLATANATTFDAFLQGWYAYVREVYLCRELPACQARWDALRDYAPSPFGSLLMAGCIDHALPVEAGGAPYNLLGMNLLGLGTVVDSLHAIRVVVYEQGACTLTDLAAAIADDFSDDALRQRLRGVSGRYGTDDEATNILVRAVSDILAEMVLTSRLAEGVRPYPAFFRFAADIYQRSTASPDGRRRADDLSYGVAPSAAVAASPTAILNSAAHAVQHRCACGAPLALTLTRNDVTGSEGVARITQLVTAYFALGGSHLHINIASADDLRRAQETPDQFHNLTVRVSGYSARFITVDRLWQETLIARAENGR